MRYQKSLITAFLISLFLTTTDFAQGFQMGGNRNNGNHQFDNMHNRWNDSMNNMRHRREDRRERWQDGWNNMQNRWDDRMDNMRNRRQDRRERWHDGWNNMMNGGGQNRGRHH